MTGHTEDTTVEKEATRVKEAGSWSLSVGRGGEGGAAPSARGGDEEGEEQEEADV